MSELTRQDQVHLSAPFELREHEIREGRSNQWYVYITERPIRQRLSDVDPAWAFEHDVPLFRAPEDGAPFIAVGARITVKGTTRGNVGTEEAKPKKGGGYQPLNENSEKAAVTDALRRAARMFDIGGYILDAPKLSGTERDAKVAFANWYNQQFASNGSENDVRSDVEDTETPALPEPEPPAEPASAAEVIDTALGRKTAPTPEPKQASESKMWHDDGAIRKNYEASLTRIKTRYSMDASDFTEALGIGREPTKEQLKERMAQFANAGEALQFAESAGKMHAAKTAPSTQAN